VSFSKVYSAQTDLLKVTEVSVETDISRGLHAFTIVGLPDKAVEEARDRVSAAIKNSGFESPKSQNQKIVISLAPAALKKEGTNFDLSIALSYLLAAERLGFSPRVYHRTIKVARTIADLEGNESVKPEHILEAVEYRPKKFDI
jgi:predicted ATPase with chaperone activity